MRKNFLAALLLLLSISFAPMARAADVTVASKIDTEGALLGNLILVMLEHHGIPFRNKTQLGPTQILRRAILAGEIDLYPEYTGNGAVFFQLENDPAWRDADAGYAKVRALDAEGNQLIWLAAAPADNSWAIAMPKRIAASHGIASLDSFARYVRDGGTVRLAASSEFVQSAGALPAFEAAYKFKLRRDQLLTLAGGDTAATIRAAAEGISGVNASMAYGTDGALASLGLIVLADDKHAPTVYRPAPVIRQAVLSAHPEIETLLDPVFKSLTLETLQKLNAEIAVDGEDAAVVAKRYLHEAGFVP